MKDKFLIKLGDRIRNIGCAQRLTQEILAEESDLTPKYVGQIERAEVNATIGSFKKIAYGLGVSLSELFSFPDSGISVTKKELLVAKFIGFIKDAEEEKIEVIDEIIENIFNWLKRMEDNNMKN